MIHERAIAELRKHAKTRGGIEIYRLSDAISLVAECEKAQLNILGLDAFFLDANSTQPSMADSTDYSGIALGTHVNAIEHLKKYSNQDIWFEVVHESIGS